MGYDMGDWEIVTMILRKKKKKKKGDCLSIVL